MRNHFSHALFNKKFLFKCIKNRAGIFKYGSNILATKNEFAYASAATPITLQIIVLCLKFVM